MKYIVLLAIVAIMGTRKTDVAPKSPMDGKWVEKVSRMDTLIFDPKLDRHFIFRSDKNIAGYRLKSTMFEYKITGDKIVLHNTVSSNSTDFSEYSFSVNDKEIVIGNFFDTDRKGILETFEKLP